MTAWGWDTLALDVVDIGKFLFLNPVTIHIFKNYNEENVPATIKHVKQPRINVRRNIQDYVNKSSLTSLKI